MKTRNYLFAAAAAGLTVLASTADASLAQYSSKPWLSRPVDGVKELPLVVMIAEVSPQELASKPWLVSPASPLAEIASPQIAELGPGYVTSKPWLNRPPQVLQFEIAPLK